MGALERFEPPTIGLVEVGLDFSTKPPSGDRVHPKSPAALLEPGVFGSKGARPLLELGPQGRHTGGLSGATA